METVLINKIEYDVPTSWSDINLQQYIDLMSIPSGYTNTNKLARIFNILAKIPPHEIRSMTYGQADRLNSLIKFLEHSYDIEPISYFDFEGESYFPEPVAQSQFGAYIDYEHYLEKHGPIGALPYLIAICCRRRIEKYGDYDMFERAESFRSLPFPIAYNVAGFFLSNSQSTRIITTLTLHQKEQLRKLTKSTDNYLKGMAGKGSYLKRLQIGMLQRLMKSLKRKQPWL